MSTQAPQNTAITPSDFWDSCYNWLQEGFGLPLNSAIVIATSVIGSSLGENLRIELPSGQVLDPHVSLLCPDTNGAANAYHAARWLTLVLRERSAYLSEFTDSLTPLQKELLQNQAKNAHMSDLQILENTRHQIDNHGRKVLGGECNLSPTLLESPEELREKRAAEKQGQRFHSNLKNASEIAKNSGLTYRELMSLDSPLVTTQRLTEDLVQHWGSLCYDGHVQIIGAGLKSLPGIDSDSDRAMKGWLDFLNEALDYHSLNDLLLNSLGQPVNARASLFLSLNPHELARFLQSPLVSSSGLMQRCILLEPCKTRIPGIMKIQQDLSLYQSLQNHIRKTRYGTSPVIIRMDDKAWALFNQWQEEIAKVESQQSDAPGREDWLKDLPILSVKLAASYLFFSPGTPITADILRSFSDVLKNIHVASTPTLVAAYQQPLITAELQCRVFEMRNKLKAKGPCSRRDLYRTYRKQTRGIHDPVLQLALQQNLIVEEAGILRATL
jgi:hypothetical protein